MSYAIYRNTIVSLAFNVVQLTSPLWRQLQDYYCCPHNFLLRNPATVNRNPKTEIGFT